MCRRSSARTQQLTTRPSRSVTIRPTAVNPAPVAGTIARARLGVVGAVRPAIANAGEACESCWVGQCLEDRCEVRPGFVVHETFRLLSKSFMGVVVWRDSLSNLIPTVNATRGQVIRADGEGTVRTDHITL
jgi:hypothetical protein